MSASSPTRPFVSVVVPYYRNLTQLRRCVAALRAQTYPTSRFEIILVNNGDLDLELDDASKHEPACHLLREPRPGSYAARNRGIAAATGELLAFIDADCLPEPAWLHEGVEAVLAGHDVVGGEVIVFPMDPRSPSAVELYDARYHLKQALYIKLYKFATTANLFCRRSVLERHGAFDATLKSGGDFEWGQRVSAAGVQIELCRDAVVRHPARRSLSSLLRKVRRVAGGHFDRARTRPRKGGRWSRLAEDLRSELSTWRRRAEPLLRDRAHGRFERTQLLCILSLSHGARAFERVRLELGGASLRT